MCGLNYTPLGDGIIRKMNRTIEHRGLPGRSSTYSDYGVNLGHVRLPIQGLSEAYDQPYKYGKYIFCFVGEIYNYKAISPKAKSDIAVLVRQWDKKGIDCFADFDWMGACLIFDTSSKELHIITDFLAKKPLYYHTGTLSVSSEIKALVPFSNGKPDRLYFSTVEKFGYRYDERTPYEEIKKINPGAHIVIKGNRVKFEYYTQLRSSSPKHLRSELTKAVRNRLTSDVPISLLASGGLDSTIVLKLALKYTQDITIFHADNGEEEFLNYLDIPSAVKIQKLQKVERPSLFQRLYYNESPLDLGSLIPQYQLACAIAAEGFNVAISGDGADELFGGYRRAKEYDSQYSDIYDELVHYHLPRLDKIMMMRTIELRCPFLARPVVECALGVPYAMRMEKEYLKSQFKDIVHPKILNREKHPLKSSEVLHGGIRWSRELSEHYQDHLMNWRSYETTEL